MSDASSIDSTSPTYVFENYKNASPWELCLAFCDIESVLDRLPILRGIQQEFIKECEAHMGVAHTMREITHVLCQLQMNQILSEILSEPYGPEATESPDVKLELFVETTLKEISKNLKAVQQTLALIGPFQEFATWDDRTQANIH